MGKRLPLREPARGRLETFSGTAQLPAQTWQGGVQAILWLILTVWAFSALVLDPLVFRLLAS